MLKTPAYIGIEYLNKQTSTNTVEVGKKGSVKSCWKILPNERDKAMRMAGLLRVSDVLAQILINRGMDDPKKASEFINPKLAHLNEPDLLPGKEPAVKRIKKAIQQKEKIAIFGDYDADGITALVLLVRLFRFFDVDVVHYIPNRITEGYGFNMDAFDSLAGEGVSLVVSVDCGVTAVKEVEYANSLGLDLIITDHHEPEEILPNAIAIVNPKLHTSQYPFRDLSGVGVAFKVAWAVAQELSPGGNIAPELRKFLLDVIGLVALGTVADVVPLLGENRILVKFGLEVLGKSRLPGVRALLATTRLVQEKLSSRHVSFRLAPRLNAAGRMGNAQLTIDLLLADSPEEAACFAGEIESHNRKRQKIQSEMLNQAYEKIEMGEDGLDERKVIVLADERWHAGVVGIVAGRLAEEFGMPAVLVAWEGDRGRGSARSVPPFNLFESLMKLEKHLIVFGGHSQAAGFEIMRDRFDQFAVSLNQLAGEVMKGERAPSLIVDCVTDLDNLSTYLANELEMLAPFGEGNRPPVIASTGVRLVGQPKLMGETGKHLSFYVTHKSTCLKAIGFNMGKMYDRLLTLGPVLDIAYVPRINRWGGGQTLELELREVISAEKRNDGISPV